jgi:hypothetical protein
MEKGLDLAGTDQFLLVANVYDNCFQIVFDDNYGHRSGN